MTVTDTYRDWIIDDLTAEHLDGEPGELVAGADVVHVWASSIARCEKAPPGTVLGR